jgi:hypothetical protein
MYLFKKAIKKYFDPLEPIPVGNVVEGNAESDWNEWEESVAFQDSQMSDYQVATVPMPLEPTGKTVPDADAPDLFAYVTKNSP